MRRGWALLLLLAAACGTRDAGAPAAHRVVATPDPTGRADVSVTIPDPTPNPTRAAAPKPAAPAPVIAAAPAPKPVLQKPAAPVLGVTSFRALGSWIDVFDHNDDPASILPLVDQMADKGVKTLYLESARYSSATDIQFPKAVGAALDAAKSRGMHVVAWYPPDFTNVDRDVRRSVAAVKFRSPKGNRFDAFAADIEYTQGVPDAKERNKRTLEYTKLLRNASGATYPLAAIVIPPTSLEVNPTRWPDFPWSELKGSYNVFMPMNYWTAREKNPKTAEELTRRNVQETQRLTGKPVHIIGGLGEHSDEQQTAAYVKAARESGSLGGGLYDFTTTRSNVWDELRKLN